MAVPLPIPIDIVNGVALLQGPRELLVGNRKEFRQKIAELFETGAREVHIDLGGTGYIDAAGLGVLVGAQRAARTIRADNRIVFLRANEDLITLFQITHLDTLFEIRP